MAGEQQIAKDIFSIVARPIATQAVEFGDKLAIGTGAAIVLLVSQLGDLGEFIPSASLFISCVLAVASLLSYMTARWLCVQATVLSDANPELVAITQRPAPNFDLDAFKKATVDISVWPATWAIRFSHRRPPVDIDLQIIQLSQKATRYIALQAVAVFVALLVLIGSFTFAEATPVERPQPAINYSRVDCMHE